MTTENFDTSVIREFIRRAVTLFATDPDKYRLTWRESPRWRRGEDGHFRCTHDRLPSLWVFEDHFKNIEGYPECLDAISSHPILGQHLNRSVGTTIGSSRVTAYDIINILVHATVVDSDDVGFDELFGKKWSEIVSAFEQEKVAVTTIIPLPRLVLPEYPLALNDDVVRDRLTEVEVTRCWAVGILHPLSPEFPIIYANQAVGIRRTIFLPKQISPSPDTDLPSLMTEGRFGYRGLFRDDLLADDVLSALRLLKPTKIMAAGRATWTDWYWLRGATTFKNLSESPFSSMEVSAEETG